MLLVSYAKQFFSNVQIIGLVVLFVSIDSYEKARRKLVKFCKGNSLESTDEDSVRKRVYVSSVLLLL